VPDVASLKVERDVGVVRRMDANNTKGVSKWQAVFDLLKQPGDSLALDLNTKGAVYAFAKKAMKAGTLPGKYVVGRCANAPATKCRVKRIA
jgi:hypothetical protein